MKHQKTIITSLIIFAAVSVLFGTGQLTEITAEEKEEYKAANGVVIKTTFRANGIIMDSDFQVYKQLSPNSKKQKDFASNNGPPRFVLEGVVNEDRAYLYEAADQAYMHGDASNHFAYGEMNMEIVLEKEGIALRQFNYENCRVSDYTVETLFDKEEGWMGKGFATVDKFTFSCQGYSPENPLLSSMYSHEEADTISSMDLIAENNDDT